MIIFIYYILVTNIGGNTPSGDKNMINRKKSNFGKLTAVWITALMCFGALAILPSASAATATVKFADGFETHSPAVPPTPPTFPPAGWGVYDGGGEIGNTFIWDSTGAHTGSGCAKCSYDYPSPNDDWITTKGTVVASAASVFSVWIDGYTYFDDEFEIYMSTVGNTPAQLLAGTMLAGVYYPSVPTVYTPYSFSMASYVGMTVYFGIRYIGNYAWYIWADDFTFPDGTTQGFEPTGGSPEIFGAFTEEHVTGSSTYNWDWVTTGTYPTCNPIEGTHMAKYYSFLASTGSQDRLYQTTPLDFSSWPSEQKGSILLYFNMYHDVGYSTNDDKIEVQVQAAPGLAWTTLASFSRYSSVDGWINHSVDLTDYADSPAVQVAFLATSAYGNNMYIDKVSIIAYGVEPWDPTTEPPTMVLMYPKGGESLKGTVNVQWFAHDSLDNYVSTNLYLISASGEINKIADGLETNDEWLGEYAWSTSSTPDGAYRLQVSATDSDMNTGHDTSDPFVIDNNAAPPANDPPVKPERPTGIANGEIGVKYTYTTTTTDPEGDQMWYMFDWGDQTNSGWLGPYKNGEICEAVHTWAERDNYNIKVKAKDNSGEESPWSDPLAIVMPYSPQRPIFQLLQWLLEQYPNAFPVLRHLLG